MVLIKGKSFQASFFVIKGSRLYDMAKFAPFSAFYFSNEDLYQKIISEPI